MSRWKEHFYTNESYQVNGHTWYHSGCKLASAGKPSENISKVTCRRCHKHLVKNHPRYKLHKLEGILELYFETGMEAMGTIFHSNRGNKEGPHWDVKNHPNETMTYRSLEWSVWFNNKIAQYHINIYNKKHKLVYSGPLTKDKKKIAESGYRFTFLPKEMPIKKWISYCQAEFRAELFTNDIPKIMYSKSEDAFTVGDLVYDDLTGEDSVVLNISIDKNGNFGYWIKSDYLQGGRHPWEISKIDWKARWKKELEQEKAKDGNQNS